MSVKPTFTEKKKMPKPYQTDPDVPFTKGRKLRVLHWTWKEYMAFRKARDKSDKEHERMYAKKNVPNPRPVYRKGCFHHTEFPIRKISIKHLVDPKPRAIWPPTVWSQAYYFSKCKVNTRMSKKEANVEDWFDELYKLINKRSVVLPEVWNKLKISKYILLSDYRKGRTIYDTILQYAKHANTDKEMVRKNRIPTSKQYKLLPESSKWKRIAKDEDFRVQGIN